MTTGFLSACKPTAPTGLKQTVGATQSGASVSVSWTASDMLGSAITTYNVWYTASGSSTASKANTDSVTALTYVLDTSKVTNGEIIFYVTATNIKGTSANSTTIKFYSADKPSAPTGLTAATSDDKATITLTWTKAVDNGAPVTGYSFSSTVGAKGTAVITTATTTAVTKTFTSEPGNTYSFMVAATNEKGTGAYSAAVPVEVPTNKSSVQEAVQLITSVLAVAGLPSAGSPRAAKARAARRSKSGWKKGSKKAAKGAAKADKADKAEGDGGDTKDGESEEKEEEEKKLDYEFGDNALNFEF